MIGKLIAAAAGQRVAQRLSGGSGPAGALAGIVAASVLRRLGPAGIIAAVAGGYMLKKHSDKSQPSAGPGQGAGGG